MPINVSHATVKMIAIHSNDGTEFVRRESAGHVAHRGIANPPTQVHPHDAAGRHEGDGGFKVSK
jgi:hypothetical protein